MPSTDETRDLAERLQHALGDDYVVDRALGAGGFAVVFLVRDVKLKRQLAVKVLSPDAITSRSALERFRREAETVAQLSHPNIVPLHFIGQQDDLVYLTMQCVDGGSLGDRLEREGRLPIDDATRIMREVAGALAHAHKRGVIHRDIKPQNILLDAETGRALVSDFGIARTAEAGPLTGTGVIIGTPAYLRPEQLTGEGSDHRAHLRAWHHGVRDAGGNAAVRGDDANRCDVQAIGEHTGADRRNATGRAARAVSRDRALPRP